MSIRKTIAIGGQEVSFKASAAILRLYRAKFRRDLFHDFSVLQHSLHPQKATESAMPDIESLEIFENIAYIMAYHADPTNVPENPEDWLEQFPIFSIYEVLPQLLELWGMNQETLAVSKKNIARLTAK